MEFENNSDQLACPSCNRDYELPRRYLLRLDDYDFAPIPRLLPCLHSMCHSCLEDQFEKSENQSIECVLCHQKDITKGINYLPLDLCILKRIVSMNSTELLANCSKCYDVVPSVSWCETCSSALCEFHHQDHKLSVETSKHQFFTFKEYFYQNKHIEFRFPPISCPECVMQDCEYYCCDCYHLISPKAFIDFHKSHEIKSIEDIFPQMKETISSAIQTSQQSIQSLQQNIQKIKEYLNQLDENEENHLITIHKQFNLIYSHLKSREKELTHNFTTAISVERKQLLGQLSNLVELMEDYQQLQKLSQQYLQYGDTTSILQSRRQTSSKLNSTPPPSSLPLPASPSSRPKKSQHIYENVYEPMYMVAATDSIEDRCDYLLKEVQAKIEAFQQQVIPMYSMEFQSQDLNMIHGTINCLGAMNQYPYLCERKELIPTHPSPIESNDLPSMTSNNNNDPGNKLNELNFGNVHFTINLGEPSDNNHKKLQQRKEHLNGTPSKASFGDYRQQDKSVEQKHSLFIETRWIPPRNYPLPLIPDFQKMISTPIPPSQKPQPHHPNQSPTSSPRRSPRHRDQLLKPETEGNFAGKDSAEPSIDSSSFQSIIEMYNKIFSEGILLGKIEINEKVMKQLKERLKYKTYFESRKQDNGLNHQKSTSALEEAVHQVKNGKELAKDGFPLHFESKTLTYLSITKELFID